MAIVFNSDAGTISGLSVGGLPDGVVDDGTLATDSVTAAKIPAALEKTFVSGRRNIIINGAMQVSQRGTSFAAIGNGDYALDRFRLYNGSIGVYTVTQDTSAPDGFGGSFKIDCTTADASPSAADYLILFYVMEGYDLQQLKKGTASAESVTLSFWVKSNKTGNAQVNFRDTDNTRIIGNTYTINSADTWEQKSITFAGDTTGAFTNSQAESAIIEWFFDSGSDRSSGSVPTSWEAFDHTNRNAGGTLALADSTSNYLNITGVQLELGSTATDFEHRSYGEELALCQRYYYRWDASSSSYLNICMGRALNTTKSRGVVDYPVTMRNTPTINSSGSFRSVDGAASTGAAVSISRASKFNTYIQFVGTSGGNLTTGAVTEMGADNDVSAWIAFDAEL